MTKQKILNNMAKATEKVLNKENQLVMEASDKILELLDEAQQGELDMPRGDLQGVVEAIVMKIIIETKKLNSNN